MVHHLHTHTSRGGGAEESEGVPNPQHLTFSLVYIQYTRTYYFSLLRGNPLTTKHTLPLLYGKNICSIFAHSLTLEELTRLTRLLPASEREEENLENPKSTVSPWL